MVTVQIKENSKQARALVEMLKTFSFVEFVEEKPRYNKETEKAIRDAREGRNMESADSVKDLFNKLNS